MHRGTGRTCEANDLRCDRLTRAEASRCPDRYYQLRLPELSFYYGKSHLPGYVRPSRFLSLSLSRHVLSDASFLLISSYGKKLYNADVSTRVSNALLIGEIIGMICVGLVTDRVGA